ncbi:MAG: ribonuclease H-like YkuK family protein [Candidatus Woykebacteria bacterium]
MEEKYISPTWGELGYSGVIGKIGDYIKADTNFRYKIIVGTDSEKRNGVTEFVTAIIIHRIGKGGLYFWNRKKVKNVVALADRISKETQFSIELAWQLRDTFRHNGLSQYEPEVHLDVGEGGLTRDMIRWVTGMVLGSGFTFKIKPESFGATKVADRHT